MARTLTVELAPPLDVPGRFMLTALAALAVLLPLYPWQAALLTGSFYDPRLIAFVHVNTLGVVGATIFGASYQILPVGLQEPLASVRLARLSWWPFAFGLIAFALGQAGGWTPLIAAGGTLLFLAVVLHVMVIARTLARAPTRGPTIALLAAGQASLLAAAALGLLLALSKANAGLGGLTLPALGAHAALIIGGWVAVTFVAMSRRLLDLFAPARGQNRGAPGWPVGILLVAGAWAVATGVLIGSPGLAAGGACGWLVGVTLFAVHAARRILARWRSEPYGLYGLTSLLALVATGVLVGVGTLTARTATDPLWIAAGWLAIVGTAETAIQGHLYRIGPFLVRLHRRPGQSARHGVPRLDEMYGRGSALVGWAGWTAAVSLGCAGALAGSLWLTQAAAAGAMVGIAAFLSNAVRAAHCR